MLTKGSLIQFLYSTSASGVALKSRSKFRVTGTVDAIRCYWPPGAIPECSLVTALDNTLNSDPLASVHRHKSPGFADKLQHGLNRRAQLNVWRQTIAESCKALNEHEERRDVCDESRQDAMIKLMGERTDMRRCMVDLMRERQQDHRLLLQPLYNCPPSFPSSIALSPKNTGQREATGTHTLNPRGLHKQQKAGISKILIWFLDLSFSSPPPP
ncbi:uncharacterized protein LOC141993257 isoform X1 [Natator depressus]|uniref:uncharacterized protein LOC141993257 isoform X1 n=1 Tax=Natator depressus TaxID=27790 RepID=UPI003EB9EAC9